MINYLSYANSIKNWLTNVRRDLHETPELGLCEYITKDKIIKYLKEIGIDFIEYENSTAVMAYILASSNTTTIALRADIDALPIQEENNVPYKSIHDGKMHACGHDAHTAILLGCCKLLYNLKNELKVNVKFLFQPAEETVGGALPMLELGCFDNPKVDYVFGLHMRPHIDCGYIQLKYDTMNASTDDVVIKIRGSKGHGAYPHEGVDSIVIASQVINSLQSIISRNIDPCDSVALTFGTISGGTRPNIICDEVTITGTLRTLNRDTREMVRSRIKDIVEFTCKGYMGSSDISITPVYDALVNDNSMVDYIKNNAASLLGEDKVIFMEKPSLGAEDFSFFLNHAKGAFFHLGCRNIEKGITSMLHSSTFNIDEDCLPIGVALQLKNVFGL